MIITKKDLLNEFLNLNGDKPEDDDNSDVTNQINVNTQTTDGYVSQARQRMEYPFNFGGTAYSRGATLQGTELGDYSGTGVNDGKGFDIENVGDAEIFSDDVYKALGINSVDDISIDDDDKRGEEFNDNEGGEEVEEEEGYKEAEDFNSFEDIEDNQETDINPEGEIPSEILDMIQASVDKKFNDGGETQINTATDLENTRPFASKIEPNQTISQKFKNIDSLVHEYYERKKTNKGR